MEEEEEHAHGASASADENPDLFYRLKLKLWGRDRMTDAIRTPFDAAPPRGGADVPHWKAGTRVVITEEADAHAGKAGRVVEYRGKGWYAVMLEDGHKATFSPMQWDRTADQVYVPKKTVPAEVYRAAHRAVDAAEGKHLARDGSPGHLATPAAKGLDVSGCLSARGKGGEGDAGVGTPSAASQSNPPPGTRVRIIRTYGGSMLPKEEVRIGETQSFAHGWYYITLEDRGKKESCRRNSFVVVGDEEDIALGFCEPGAGDGSRGRKFGHDVPTPSDRDGGESGGRNREGEDKAEREPARAYTGKKRGRKPKELQRVESESDDDESDDDEGDVRKKGKKGKSDGNKESREEEEVGLKREKESARRQREKELEEREREKEREKERERERQRAQEAEAEANMTQEERDALEAARLAAMLNRNPRRRGGGDGPVPGIMPRIPVKKPKEKKEKE